MLLKNMMKNLLKKFHPTVKTKKMEINQRKLNKANNQLLKSLSFKLKKQKILGKALLGSSKKKDP